MTRRRSAVRWLMLAVVILTFCGASFSQIAVGISVRVGPPPLPVYAQPICPGPGYFWTPGYWAWNDDDGYYWVPGTWVVAPVGMLWTPGYWGWNNGFYLWHGGYWGPHIGFYGGINYGFGYTGVGFVGGEWRGRDFYYNRSVTNVSVTNVTRVYNRTVIVNNTRNVSYNGGNGGIEARPSRQEEMAAHERHVAPVHDQVQHEHMAAQNRQNFASQNHGRPTIAATSKPGDFSGRSAVPARSAGGEYHAPAMSPREARGQSTAGNRGNSNAGFRPFTPPSKGGSSAENTSRGNASRSNETRSNTFRPNENRSNESRPAPSRQPSESRMTHPAPQTHESAPRQNSHPAPPPPSRQPSESRMTHPAPQTHESAPRQNSHPAPPPRQGSPEHHKGR